MEAIKTESIESNESPIGIDIQFGIDIDTNRLKDTIERLPWYKEKGYNIKIPGNLSESSTREEISELVSAEYSEEKYKEISAKIEEIWPTFSAPFEELKNIPSFHFGEKYKVSLTGYGTGGSYHASTSEIIIGDFGGDIERIIKVMAHEIVHTGIEYLIQKYKVPHWKKERLVDLICEKYFSKRKQNIREDVSDVDEAFNSFWPDIEAITRKIGQEKLYEKVEKISSNREILKNLEEKGVYLFHGSENSSIETFEPRQAYNFATGTKRPDGEPAVFASPEADYAIAMALINAKNCPKGFHVRVGHSAETGLNIRISQKTLDQLDENSVGYVYIFNKNNFKQREKSKTEYLSTDSVIPEKTIEVRKSDLPVNIEITDN